MKPGWLPAPIGAPQSLRDLARVERCSALLQPSGLAPDAVQRVAPLVTRCAELLSAERRTDAGRITAFFVPGRIEVLGKHTDYAGGRSLICAVDRGFVVMGMVRDDRRVLVHDAVLGQHADLILDEDLPAAPGHWSDYVRTVVRRLARNFDHGSGADIVLASDLPPAAGLSSSSALVVGTFLPLAACGWLADDPRYAATIETPEALAGYLAAVENGLDFATLEGGRGVGTLGGSQDHTAILCARPDALVRYSFAPVRAEGAVPIAHQWTFVVASSGVRAEKSAAALARYNRLAQLARDAAAVWRSETGSSAPHLGAILHAGDGDALVDVLRRSNDPDTPARVARAEQFLEEAGVIIPAAYDALGVRDIDAFGRLVARSHHLAETKLKNQIAETVALAASARSGGAAAASAFGAGFGGSVWALVRAADASAFVDSWRAAYLKDFAVHRDTAAFFAARPGPAAMRIA
jgi:galactokinase